MKHYYLIVCLICFACQDQRYSPGDGRKPSKQSHRDDDDPRRDNGTQRSHTSSVVFPKGSIYLAGISNQSRTCYLNAGLQALFAADELNNHALLFGDDEIFANNHFMRDYLIALERYRQAAALSRPMQLEDLNSLKSDEHNSFVALQTLLTVIDQMPSAEEYFVNVTMDIASLNNHTIEDMVASVFRDRHIKPTKLPKFLIVMLNNNQSALLNDNQKNKISFKNVAPIDDDRARYSLIAAVETCYEGNLTIYRSPNHVVAYKKVNDQWYFVNDSQFEARSEEEVKARINSGNTTERVPGRESKFMVPSTLIYELHSAR